MLEKRRLLHLQKPIIFWYILYRKLSGAIYLGIGIKNVRVNGYLMQMPRKLCGVMRYSRFCIRKGEQSPLLGVLVVWEDTCGMIIQETLYWVGICIYHGRRWKVCPNQYWIVRSLLPWVGWWRQVEVSSIYHQRSWVDYFRTYNM